MCTYMRGDTGQVGAASLTKARQQLLMGHVADGWTLSSNHLTSQMLLDMLLQVFRLVCSDLGMLLAVVELPIKIRWLSAAVENCRGLPACVLRVCKDWPGTAHMQDALRLTPIPW